MKLVQSVSIVFMITAALSPLAKADMGFGAGGLIDQTKKDGKTSGSGGVAIEFFSEGDNPQDKAAANAKKNLTTKYGYTQMSLEAWKAGEDKADVGFSIGGLGGYQLIGASSKSPDMFHLGIEPFNFQMHVDSTLPFQIEKKVVEKAAASHGVSLDSPEAAAYGEKYGVDVSRYTSDSAKAPKKDNFVRYLPAVSMGYEHLGDTCRVLALVRGGAAAYASVDKEGAGVAPAAGVGGYLNCRRLDINFDATRIMDKNNPIDMYNVDAVLGVSSIPLAIGVRAESVITHSAEDKALFSSQDAKIEKRALATGRLVF